MMPLADVACAVLMISSTVVGQPSTTVDSARGAPQPSIDSASTLVRPVGITTLGRVSGVPNGLGVNDGLAQDTIRKPRAKSVEYGDGYAWRLTLHRRLSWGMLPLFAASYFSGDEILKASADGREAKSWARNLHRPAATGSAVLFGANTITGTLNLWEGRSDPNGRKRRLLHSALFIASSGGFVYAGTKLANDAEQSRAKRQQHRNVALASMGTSTLSWLIMLVGN